MEGGLFPLDLVGLEDESVEAQPIQQLAKAIRSADAALPLNFEDERKWVDATIVLREGQGAFREAVLKAYDYRCSISNCAVAQVLEAAHIHRYFGKQTNLVCNGLLLRADLHTLYDRALIAIEPETFEVLVSPKLTHSEYGSLAGQKISLPKNLANWPYEDALLEHKRWVRSEWDKG